MTMLNKKTDSAIEAFILQRKTCKEYDIICHLKSLKLIDKNALSSPLSLFRHHFLIYNCLYRLQLNCTVHQKYFLNISSVNIQVSAFTLETDNNDQHVSHYDPLALFYLDLSHLENSNEQQVQSLLDKFWQHYFCDDKKQQALSILELSEASNFKDIKKQYRRLAMIHHPDRGGDSEKLTAIHQAMLCLQHFY